MFAIFTVDNKITTSNNSDMAAELWKLWKPTGVIQNLINIIKLIFKSKMLFKMSLYKLKNLHLNSKIWI